MSGTGGERVKSKAKRADIQGLRAIAVGLVVLAHSHFPFFDGGFVGVDVFFVLSGFLITGLLINESERSGRISIPGFYAAGPAGSCRPRRSCWSRSPCSSHSPSR